jgi:hypothetical protein
MKRQQHRKNYPSGIRSAGGQTTLQSFLVKPRLRIKSTRRFPLSDSHPSHEICFFLLGIQSVLLRFSCFRVVDDDVKPSPLPPPEVGEEEAQICPPEPPKREIVRVIRTTIKEKASAFSSVGSAGKDGGGEAGGALSAAVFKRFHSSAPVARAEGDRAEAGEDGERDFGGGGDVRLDVEEIGAASRPEPRNKRKSPLGARPPFSPCIPLKSFPSFPPLRSHDDDNVGSIQAATSTGATPRPGAWWCSATTRGHGRRGGGGAPGPPAAAARAAAPCTTTVRSIPTPELEPLGSGEPPVSERQPTLWFRFGFRRERRRLVARRHGGRGRRGGRLDRRHVGGYGLRHARRLGVALAAARSSSRTARCRRGTQQMSRDQNVRGPKCMTLLETRNFTENSLIPPGIR